MPQNEDKPVVYSALEVAKICGVVNQTAINWIRSGFLKAFKTPGGQFRVYPADLAEFMFERKMKLPEELIALCGAEKYERTSLLIVDDDRGLNAVVAKYMEKRFPELELYQAYDGFEAGSLMSEKKPGSLILDLDLPGIDGFELCKKINETGKFGNPSIIVVTALENAEVENKVNALGVKCFLKKPLDLSELAGHVEECFSRT